MLRLPISLTLAVLTLATAQTTAQRPTTASGSGQKFWPTWRGPLNTGTSPTAQPPTEWSETKNVRWKVELPGRGSASPVVWGNHVYVLTAVPAERAAGARGVHRFLVMALNRKDGKVVWQQTAKEEAPHEGTHQEFGTMASPSALTDGEHIIASFESRGIYAYDMNGKPVWQKDLGDKRMRNEFGEGSTPALYKDKLFVVWDHQAESFIVALNKRTGEEIWRTKRDEIDSWATPLVVEHEGRAQVVTGAMRGVRAYDAETGKVIWETGGLTMNPIPSPVAADGFVYLMSGFRGNALKADRARRGEGGHHRNAGHCLDAGSRYALCAIAAALRRDSLFPEKQQRAHQRIRGQDRQAALPGATYRRTTEQRIRFTCGGGGPDLRPGAGGDDGRLQAWTDHGGSRDQQARRSLRCVAGAGRREIYLRGYKSLYSIGE